MRGEIESVEFVFGIDAQAVIGRKTRTSTNVTPADHSAA
jgi:hypothetical protein